MVLLALLYNIDHDNLVNAGPRNTEEDLNPALSWSYDEINSNLLLNPLYVGILK